eukprot:3893105-Prymnesium_polylepis.2
MEIISRMRRKLGNVSAPPTQPSTARAGAPGPAAAFISKFRKKPQVDHEFAEKVAFNRKLIRKYNRGLVHPGMPATRKWLPSWDMAISGEPAGREPRSLVHPRSRFCGGRRNGLLRHRHPGRRLPPQGGADGHGRLVPLPAVSQRALLRRHLHQSQPRLPRRERRRSLGDQPPPHPRELPPRLDACGRDQCYPRGHARRARDAQSEPGRHDRRPLPLPARRQAAARRPAREGSPQHHPHARVRVWHHARSGDGGALHPVDGPVHPLHDDWLDLHRPELGAQRELLTHRYHVDCGIRLR